jgi:para-nitrobenzyl esterase
VKFQQKNSYSEPGHCLKIKIYLYPLLLAFGLLLQSFPSKAQNKETIVPGDPVKIASGFIAGKMLPEGVKAYLGIPYAAPPVGNLRWREPQPVQSWTGIRSVTEYCAPCAQKSAGFGASPSEDCLYLNLWAPSNHSGGKMPVIVYIVGTGYRNGSASTSLVSGEVIAKKGVVFINFNYRMAVFGNLALAELAAESPNKTTGNYVHLDEIAVLHWVRDNIAQFGGDPDNVTLMGQSSGGIDVSFLQTSPLAKGLFHRVLASSGSTFPGGPWPATPLKVAEQEGSNYMQKLGVKTLAELRALPYEKLVEASIMGVEEPLGADGYVLPLPSPEMFAAHKENKVPVILNSCRDESFGSVSQVKTVDELKSTLQKIAGNKADEILSLYPVSSDEEAKKAGAKIGQESSVGKMMVQHANAQVASNSPVYLSIFSYGERAGHGSDVPYWLGTVLLPSSGGRPGQTKLTEKDIALTNKMMDALVAFAKTGNPNTADIRWPEYSQQNKSCLIIGENIEPQPIGRGIDFFISNREIKFAF